MNLTIVMPAFNASKTITDTIISLEKIIFQSKGGLIIVNDCSTDDTVSKILYLKNKKKINIKILHHKENLGGGAARNTAIKIANTKYILMCDSDNIYDSSSISQLYNCITKKNIDGVHPQKSLNFFTSIDKIEYEFDYLKKFFFKKKVLFKDILNSNFFLDNFLFTKDSWKKICGYNENHGFDSQSFWFKYLLFNNTLEIVPNTFNYHRIYKSNKSYYQREVNINNNKFINIYLVVENVLFFKKYRSLLFNIFDKDILTKINSQSLLCSNFRIKNKVSKNLINKYYMWFKFFIKKKYEKCLNISSDLMFLKPKSQLAIYLFYRSVFYKNKLYKKNLRDVRAYKKFINDVNNF